MTRSVLSKIILWGIFLLILAGVGYYAFNGVHALAMTWNITGLGPGFSYTNPTPTPDPNEPTPTLRPGETPSVSIPTDNLGYDAWDGAERVTILIMGLDYRDWEAGEGAPRTDTMILLTIDPLSKTAGMLSIPRDLYVSIPGFEDYDRINTAYRQGEIYQLPGGGPALAVQTVEQLIGVKIDFYAQVDFYAFIRMIDEIGGLKIEVTEPIEIDPIGEKPPRTLQPGRYTMPGEIALAYARARHTEGGDFDRARRQQQVVLAIRERILSFDLIPILITKASALYNELSEGVNTNMNLEQAIRLAILGKDIPLDSIRKGVIGEEQIVFFTTPDGDQVLKPRPDAIRELRDYVFGTVELSSPLANLTDQERVTAEDAVVSILNASFTEGLAARTAQFLTGLGFNIPEVNIGNANQALTFTTIVDYTGNPYTVKLLAETLNVQSNRVLLDYNPNSPVDVEVSLGSDWAGNNPLP